MMKKILVMFLVALAVVGCDQDDTPVDTTGSVSFVVTGSTLGVGKSSGFTPERLLVSVEDVDGKTILDNKVLTLTSSDLGYTTESLVLDRGEYKITKYLVISGEIAAYATPKTGAEKAELIDQPLPVHFSIEGSMQNSVAPKVIGISSEDVPANFGYSDFGFDVPQGPSSEEWMSVRVKLEMILGGIYYPNIDAPVIVRAHDASDAVVWEEEFTYMGPEPNDLKIKTGYSRYSIEFNKWGKTLQQKFMATHLWEGRVREGVVPVTYVFQTTVAPKKVNTTVTSWSRNVNGAVVVEPINKVRYEYLDGRIYLINSQTYNKNTSRFVDDSQTEVIYEGDRVKKLETWLAGQDSPYSETNYTYDAEGYATHIQHKGIQTGITTEVDLTYQYGDRVIKASYRLSNGTGFEYEMVSQHGSQKSDRTTRGSQVCSEATFTYDKGVNPLKHLGYTDYLLRNYSISNRTSEDARYVGCAFPSLIPETYEYEYDADGYPLVSRTFFRGSNATTQIEYTYLE
jgi:hypothetical protein